MFGGKYPEVPRGCHLRGLSEPDQHPVFFSAQQQHPRLGYCSTVPLSLFHSYVAGLFFFWGGGRPRVQVLKFADVKIQLTLMISNLSRVVDLKLKFVAFH